MGHHRVRFRGSAAGLTLVLLALVLLPAPAAGLTARFKINGGAAYATRCRLTVGDGGWSPFFTPGVAVWHGGSVIGGRGADDAHRFPALTLALLPRACRSFVSETGGALIADMIADAPAQVDVHCSATADLDLCVAQPGGGDLRSGNTAAYVYQGLRTYCSRRRAAGFTTVVLTVLPSGFKEGFEPRRLAYNQMLRDTWPEFADGLVDVAADPRIGDTGDNLDQSFFLDDAMHPNNAGNEVMATVAAPVLAGLDWRSASCEVRLREAGEAWGEWHAYRPRETIRLADGNGRRTVQAEYRSGDEQALVSDAIFVDTVRPSVTGLRGTRVAVGGVAKLRYRVLDPRPCGPTATVRVAIFTTGGGLVKRFPARVQRVGVRHVLRFVCHLRRGTYRYTVRVRDAAGNLQTAPAAAGLAVS